MKIVCSAILLVGKNNRFLPLLLSAAFLFIACGKGSGTSLAPAPSNVVATYGDGKVTISWTGVTGATSYNLYYRATAGVTTANGTKVSGATSGVVVSNLTNGVNYYFVVASVNAGGEGAVSAEVSATPHAPLPGTPTGVTATPGDGQVVVDWTAITGAISYNVYYRNIAGVTTAAGTRVSSGRGPVTITNLVNYTPYYFVVTSVSATGESSVSTEVSATPGRVATTLAGTAGANGTANGTGAGALFFQPHGVATDGTNIYVSDTYNNTIRKVVIATGAVSTIAGNSYVMGSTDASGLNATFGLPSGLTTDGANLYVADAYNHTIRKVVIATGAVTTIAGTATLRGTADGTGAAARFNSPTAVTTDGANLYVADTNNNTIRQIVIATGVVSTFAGSAGTLGSSDGTRLAARFYSPGGITTDGANLFVADSANHTIRQIVISTGTVTTLAGGVGLPGSADGTGTNARFNLPNGVTTDGTNLYVADTDNNAIRQIVIATGAVTTIVGTAGVTGSTDGAGGRALFYRPYDVTTYGTILYVADTYNNTIRKIP